jgi:hypothetical protein
MARSDVTRRAEMVRATHATTADSLNATSHWGFDAFSQV